jgi:hypothetical protein
VAKTKAALAMSLRALLGETIEKLGPEASRVRAAARATRFAVEQLERVGPSTLSKARDRLGELRVEFETLKPGLQKLGAAPVVEYVQAGSLLMTRSVELLLPMSPNATTVLLPPGEDPEKLERVEGTPLERVRKLPEQVIQRRVSTQGHRLHRMLDLCAQVEELLERATVERIDATRAAILPLSQIHLDLKHPKHEVKEIAPAFHSVVSGVEALFEAGARHLK